MGVLVGGQYGVNPRLVKTLDVEVSTTKMRVLFVLSSIVNVSHLTQVFLETPAYSETKPGETVLLSCVIANKGGKCQWEKDGTPVGMFPSKYEWAGDVESGNCSLVIFDASSEYDDGVWQCQVTASNFEEGDSLISDGAEVVVRAAAKDITISKSEEIKGNEGDTSEVECLSSGANPPAKLYFEVDGIISMENSYQTNIRLESGGWRSTLKMPLLLERNIHHLQIECKIEDNINLSDSTMIDINYAPVIQELLTEQLVVNEGEPLSIRCTVDSNPRAVIYWKHPEGNKIVKHEVLILNEATKEDAGKYVCVAENIIGKVESDPIEVKVNHAPEIKSVGPSEMILVNIDEMLFLTCMAESVPPPAYRWLQKTLHGEIKVVGKGQNLVVEKASYDQTGEYVCEAQNEIRNEKLTALSDLVKVEVNGAPKFAKFAPEHLKVDNGEDLEVAISYCSNPASELSWVSSKQGSLKNKSSFSIKHVNSAVNFCYETRMRIENTKSGHTDEYTIELVNEYGSTSHTIKLDVEGSDFPLQLIFGVSSGLLFMILIILIFVTIKITKHRRNVKDVESCGTSTVSDAESDQKSDHSKSHLFKTSISNINSQSKNSSMNFPPSSYSELCFPKSSNCGSMRKKKDKHYQDLMNVYNTAIMDNINTSIYASIPRKNSIQCSN